MKELIIKKCLKCGAVIRVLEDCHCDNCGIICCGEKMVTLKPNSTDAAFEKHIPSYEVDNDNIVVKVSHVMNEDHFIEWIAFINDFKEEFVYFKPNAEAKTIFKKEKGVLYAYCNKHGLWSREI